MKTNKVEMFDTVAVVRAVRDRIFEETKSLSAEERIAYFRSHGQKAASAQPVQETNAEGVKK